MAKLAKGREEYYLAQVASGVEDYYLRSGEDAGFWMGGGIADLALVGEVAANDLRAVLAGHSPDGVALARASRKVPGFDLTFRAPKSVSLLHALGSPEVATQVLASHDAAVAETLSYLEREACFTRRGPQGRIGVPGRGFVAAAFRHRTSREAEPLLHTHILIANLVLADGRWGTVDGRLLYLEAKTGRYLYQAVLRAELTRRLGVEWGPIRHGLADIKGVPRAVIDAFSTRRRQILDELERRGEHSAAAAQVATLTTRKTKQHLDRQTLLTEWRRRAHEIGFDNRAIRSLLHQASAKQVNQPTVSADQLLGPDGLTSRRSSFTRRDVLQAWCSQLPAGAHIPVVERLTDTALTSDDVVPLHDSELAAAFAASLRRRDGVSIPAVEPTRFTTREMAAQEHVLVDSATRRQHTEVAVVERRVVDASLRLRPSLGDDQRELVRRVCRDGNGIDVIVGKAGAGKTLALDAARAAWQASGTVVIGCSLAARAAAQLQADAGIPSATIDRLEREMLRRKLPAGAVVIVDEAAMVGTRRLTRLASTVAQANGKLVLVGDDRQLPAIDAGGGFRAVSQAIPPIRLETNRRQRHRWERDALDELSSGRAEEALRAYDEHGRITSRPSAHEAREALVADWFQQHQAGGNAPMLALQRSDVDDLNQRARRLLANHGLLGDKELVVGGRWFAVGDRVIGRRNDYRAGILNGTRGTITALQPRAGTLTVTTEGGEELQLARSYLQRGFLDYGYASTVHQSQGGTWDEAFVLGDDRLYREAGYVALSRARESTRVYVVDGDEDDEHHTHQRDNNRLIRALTNARAEASIRELRGGGVER